jgi:hypothetical protein
MVALVEPEPSPPRPFPWRVLFLLWALAAVGIVAVVPYSLTIQGPLLAKLVAGKSLPLPVPALIALQLVQGAVTVAALAALGLFLARRIELGAPILERWQQGGEPLLPQLRAVAPRALTTGAAAGTAIALLDWLAFSAGMREELARAGLSSASLVPPAWQGLLASFYGGLDEEMLTRLFLLSSVAWIGARISGAHAGRPSAAVLWVANILAALLFAAGHLPAVKAIGLPLDAFMVARTLLLNSAAGVAFGWLYVSLGLEAAMLAHFTADMILHVLSPFFGLRSL